MACVQANASIHDWCLSSANVGVRACIRRIATAQQARRPCCTSQPQSLTDIAAGELRPRLEGSAGEAGRRGRREGPPSAKG